MTLRKLPYRNLDQLFRDYLTTEEDPHTKGLIKEIAEKTKLKGFIGKKQLKQICYWKSPRAIKQIERNSAGKIKTIILQTLSEKSVVEKMNLLLQLYGVGIPMASSILMFLNPKRFGVIDIRVWQVLYQMKKVGTKQTGIGFNIDEFEKFTTIIQFHSNKTGYSARDIERALFDAHRDFQSGTLY